MRGVEFDDTLFAAVADCESFEDDPLSLLPELEPKTRDVEGTLMFEGPRFERDGQPFAVRMDAVAQRLSESGEEGCGGCGDLHVGEFPVGHTKEYIVPSPLKAWEQVPRGPCA